MTENSAENQTTEIPQIPETTETADWSIFEDLSKFKDPKMKKKEEELMVSQSIPEPPVQPTEEDEINKIVDEKIPLPGKDVPESERKKIYSRRNKLKKKLKNEANTRRASMGLQPIQDSAKPEPQPLDEKERLIQSVLGLQSLTASSRYTAEELRGMALTDVQRIADGLAIEASNILMDEEECGFTFLLMMAQGAESMSMLTREYGVDFTGVVKRHLEKKEELKKILGRYIQANPHIREYLSPGVQLLISLGSIYGTVAIENNLKSVSSGSSA